MDLWLLSEETGALVKAESLRIRRKYEGGIWAWALVAGNSAGETTIAYYATEKEAAMAVKRIAMELDSIKPGGNIKVLAVKKTGQVASLLAAV